MRLDYLEILIVMNFHKLLPERKPRTLDSVPQIRFCCSHNVSGLFGNFDRGEFSQTIILTEV